METPTTLDGAEATTEDLLAEAADRLEALPGEGPARALEHIDAAMAALHAG